MGHIVAKPGKCEIQKRLVTLAKIAVAIATKVLPAHPLSDLATMFGVDEASIRNWEKNTYQPIERHMEGVVK
jgi:hypothetical protein